MVIASDTARYGIESGGEPTQGAGAVAMLISHQPRILQLNDDAVLIQQMCMISGDRLAINIHLLQARYQKTHILNHSKKVGKSMHVVKINHYPILNHYVSTCLLLKWAKALDSIINDTDETTQSRLTSGYEDAVYYNRYVGNIYTGSLYLSLISLLENRTLTPGQTIGLFSYGSGSVGEFFSATVVEGFEQHLDKKHQALLNERQEVSVKEYESFFRRFDDLSFDHEIESVENDKNIFYLENIEDDIRYYHSPE